MIRFKAWLILSSGFWAEFWHLIIPLSLYLWLAIRLDGSLASWRAFRIVALVAMAFELEEAIEKWAFGLRIDGPDIWHDLRDGLLWPLVLSLFGRRLIPERRA